jgi:hypothetical protein
MSVGPEAEGSSAVSKARLEGEVSAGPNYVLGQTTCERMHLLA